MKKTKFSAADNSAAKACVIGSVVALLLMIVLALLSAVFISNEYFEIKADGYLAGAVRFAAVFAGCFIAGKMTANRKAVACGIVSAVSLFSQLGAAIMFFDGISGTVILGILPTIAACGCSILLCMNRKNRSGSKRRRTPAR